MKYFAYGSNMSISRLKHRTPSARRLGYHILWRHILRFHKSSQDGSGKCDAYFTGNDDDCVFGVLFEIEAIEKPALDTVEGLGYGYQEKTVTLLSPDGDKVEAMTYYAINIDSSLNPYSWYLNHVLVGAKESELPEKYIAKIEAVKSIQDQDKNRDKKARSIHI